MKEEKQETKNPEKKSHEKQDAADPSAKAAQTTEEESPKKLWIVRHGQTLFNKKHKIQGWCDSPLTPKGHEQASRVKEYMKKRDFHPDYFACSTLGRTEQTLKDVTDHPYERIEGLKEFHYGELEGEDISKGCGAKGSLETFYKPYGGESKSEVEERMNKAVREIMDRPDVHDALLVSHGACSYRFAHTVDPVRAKKLRKFANCMIYEYEYKDGEFKLVDIIDKHVKDLAGD